MTVSSDDELISAYVDGTLSGPDRAAFEARAQADAALRRRVAATRLLTAEARQLPNATVPRNFILPRNLGQKQPVPQPKRTLFPAWVFRIGSVAAALLFVSALAVEVARPAAFSPSALPYSAPAPAPVEAPAPAAPMADMARNAVEATVTLGAMAEGATTNVQPMIATLALPTIDMAQAQTKAEPGAAVLSSAEASGAAESGSAPETLLLTATPAPAPAPAATLPEIAAGPEVSQRSAFTVPVAVDGQTAATPEPAPVTAPPPQAQEAQAEPLITPLRALAVVALITALVLGALGWLRK
jgi:hypothetical protein